MKTRERHKPAGTSAITCAIRYPGTSCSSSDPSTLSLSLEADMMVVEPSKCSRKQIQQVRWSKSKLQNFFPYLVFCKRHDITWFSLFSGRTVTTDHEVNVQVSQPDSMGGCFVYSCNMPAAVERLGKIRVRSLKFVACLTGHPHGIYIWVCLWYLIALAFSPTLEKWLGRRLSIPLHPGLDFF